MNNTDNKTKSISIIIPAFNEEAMLEASVLRTKDTFISLNFDFEIIIVNDKSSDKTAEIGENLSRREKNIRIIHHEKNKGIGASFLTGINCATGEYIIFVPVDNPLEEEDVLGYIPKIDVGDIVVGCRVERVGYSKPARFASFVYNRILIPLFFNIGISDVNWIQIYRRRLFTDGIIKFRPSKVFFLVEILVQARRKRLIIAEVSARMKKRFVGKPTHSNIYVICETLFDMWKYFRQLRKEDRL